MRKEPWNRNRTGIRYFLGIVQSYRQLIDTAHDEKNVFQVAGVSKAEIRL
jgi:hypothetical protein